MGALLVGGGKSRYVESFTKSQGLGAIMTLVAPSTITVLNEFPAITTILNMQCCWYLHGDDADII